MTIVKPVNFLYTSKMMKMKKNNNYPDTLRRINKLVLTGLLIFGFCRIGFSYGGFKYWFDKGKSSNNPDEEIKYYTKALKEWSYSDGYKDKALAYYSRGLAYSDKGTYDEAIKDFTKTIEVNPKEASAYNNRGNAYFDKCLYDRAINDYTNAIKISPKYAEAYFTRGAAYTMKGLYDEAIEDLAKATELNPKLAETPNIRGIAYNLLPQSYIDKKTNESMERTTKVKLGILRAGLTIYYGEMEGRSYPKTLNELVPKYIDEIPAVKLGDKNWAGEETNTWKLDPTPNNDITADDIDDSTT